MGIQDEIAARLLKLKHLRDSGVDPYPARARRTHTIASLLANWDKLESGGATVILTGRLRSSRQHGGLIFAHLEDGSGRMQIALRRDTIGSPALKTFDDTFDIGDFLEVQGTLFKTKLGERTLNVSRATMLAKSLLPLPEKWHGLSDTEIRYRQRYLDLLANPEVRALAEKRSLIVRAIKNFFDERNFLEVETPILQPIPGGANAEPFLTHHNALNSDFYLRIAPELYLKRLLVGGFERVYEIARCFRNEGIDHLHNPEFSQVEAYQAYADYEDFMKLIEDLLPFVASAIGLDLKAVKFEDETIDFTPPYPRMTFNEAIKQFGRLDLEKYPDRIKLAKAAEKAGVSVAPEWSRGKIMDELFKTFVRPKIVRPTFITDHPIELSPLAKRKSEDEAHVERFQLLVGKGIELVNAFSELNDPLDQEARFRTQEEARERGETETQRLDNDFIAALKHGMPPAAGLGIGIDRLTALLTNSHNIKEVILFPTLRPE